MLHRRINERWCVVTDLSKRTWAYIWACHPVNMRPPKKKRLISASILPNRNGERKAQNEFSNSGRWWIDEVCINSCTDNENRRNGRHHTLKHMFIHMGSCCIMQAETRVVTAKKTHNNNNETAALPTKIQKVHLCIHFRLDAKQPASYRHFVSAPGTACAQFVWTKGPKPAERKREPRVSEKKRIEVEDHICSADATSALYAFSHCFWYQQHHKQRERPRIDAADDHNGRRHQRPTKNIYTHKRGINKTWEILINI